MTLSSSEKYLTQTVEDQISSCYMCKKELVKLKFNLIG